MKWNGRGAVVAPATRVALNVGPRTGIIGIAKCVLTLAINLLIGRIRLQIHTYFSCHLGFRHSQITSADEVFYGPR